MNIISMDLQLFDIVGRFISCMVTVFIVFQYFDAKYIRVYQSRMIYSGWKILCCLMNLLAYLLDNPVINITFWIFIVSISGKLLYYDEIMNKIRYYLTHITFMLAYSTCEAVGGVLVDAGVKLIHVNQNNSILAFVYTMGSSASAMLLYYLILKRLFVNNETSRIPASQYTIYTIITAYVLVNIGEILFLINHELSDKDYLFLMVDAAFIIFINLYLFHLLDAFAENKDLKYKITLYERQAKSNYDYYAKQVENHRKALAVIHDVRKHMRIVDEYEKLGAQIEKEAYANSFEEMVSPLLIKQYCSNAILNIIINDKQEECEKKGITFQVDISEVSIDFMEPIDITTIFGNILDNAVEACEKVIDKQIHLKIYPFRGLIYVQLSNTFVGEVIWNANGRPLSQKGEQHGIGLENVEKVLQSYNGNIEFSVEQKQFMIEMMFNQM